MVSLFPALVVLLVVLAIGLYIGNKYGRVQVRNELREFRLMLLNRKSEIEAKFKAATKKFSEAEANFLSVRLKAEKLLSDAREKADRSVQISPRQSLHIGSAHGRHRDADR